MMSTAARFSLRKKPRFDQTSRRKKSLLKVKVADVGRVHYRCQQRTWNLHSTQPSYFAPQNSQVVNLTGLAENKGLDVLCGKWCLFAMNKREQWFAVGSLSILRIDRGPRFTSAVSPKNNMLGKQITTGQLTNKECTMMPIHVTKINMRFIWALRQNT